MSGEQPWLEYKPWANNCIASDARRAHWVMWGFAIFWNLVSMPLMFQLGDIWQKTQREPLTALAFLFPLVGVALVIAAIAATRQKKHFGLTPLIMDPYPGSLGGQVGGRVETGIPYVPDRRFGVVLSCLQSRMSGSGKNRSRSESIVWHSDGVCHSEPHLAGTALQFRFEVPADLPASELHRGNSYHLWRVRISAELPGMDFDRAFEIPVFDTGKQVSGIKAGTESHPASIDAAMDGVQSVADIRPIPGGIEALFPAMQRPGQGIVTGLFGATFAGIGIAVGFHGASLAIAFVFALVGSLLACYGMFYLGKSLLVRVNREGISSRRFLFGYPLTTRRLGRGDLIDIEISQGATMQSGNKKTVYYQLLANGRDTRRFPLAERLTSRSEADLIKETYLTYLGMNSGSDRA